MQYQICQFKPDDYLTKKIVSETKSFDGQAEAQAWLEEEEEKLEIPEGYSIALVPENHGWFEPSEINKANMGPTAVNPNLNKNLDGIQGESVPFAEVAKFVKEENQKKRIKAHEEQLKLAKAMQNLTT